MVLKQIVSIFLLLQITSNNAFAEGLVKMPRLFTHYYHHAREHKDTKDFFDFLHKHYSDHENDKHSKNHNNEDNDCNLPFKHCGGCCLNVHTSTPVFLAAFLNTDYPSLQIKNEGFYFKNDKIENLNLSSIWQPPKLA